MLFRTGLALMEIHGIHQLLWNLSLFPFGSVPVACGLTNLTWDWVVSVGVLMQKRDTGDAVTMLQSMGEATFDSSQLVLAACLGFHDFHEDHLEQLRNHHRPSVLSALHERSLELHLWRSKNGVATKAGSLVEQVVGGSLPFRNPVISFQAKLGHFEPASESNSDVSLLGLGLNDDEESGRVDLQEQVKSVVILDSSPNVI